MSNIFGTVSKIEKLGISVPGGVREDLLEGTILQRQGQIFLVGLDPILTVADLARTQSPGHARQAVEAWNEDGHMFARYSLVQNP